MLIGPKFESNEQSDRCIKINAKNYFLQHLFKPFNLKCLRDGLEIWCRHLVKLGFHVVE